MAVGHVFKATNVFLSTSGGASLSGEVALNDGATPVKVHVDIAPPSPAGRSEAVIFGPLSNARITIETFAHENTVIALRAGSRVSIRFESDAPVSNTLVAGHRFSSFSFSISRTLDA
jgi:hypothetical protein